MTPKVLLVDIGNTSAHFALCGNGASFGKEARIRTSEIASTAKKIISKKYLTQKKSLVVVAASVVPEATKALQQVVRDQLKLPFYVVGRDFEVPVVNRYKKPKQVGIDRLLNACAGYKTHGGPLIIIDFGTAITFDLVSKKGEYLGGVIAPGIEITLEALFQKTALLPKIRLTHPRSLVGRDTTESIRVGCSYGIGGLCDRIVEEVRRHCLPGAQVVATGGYAHFMRRYCKIKFVVDPPLVLRGILKSYQTFLKKS